MFETHEHNDLMTGDVVEDPNATATASRKSQASRSFPPASPALLKLAELGTTWTALQIFGNFDSLHSSEFISNFVPY